jgi:hypothetical protein
MADNIHLIPEYLESDFLSMKEKLINLLKNTDTFKDYNYEGANITLLLELVSYLGDFTNFYMNEIAKNVYPDTTNLYETTHSLVSQRGYTPKGYISAELDLKVTIKKYNDDNTIEYFNNNDQLYIPAWFPFNTGIVNNNDEDIWYTTIRPETITIPSSGAEEDISFFIPLKQGKPFVETYNGNDLIDGNIILPFKNIDMGIFPYDQEKPSIIVYVNEEIWTRVDDFYNELSGLYINDNVYKLVYDKYGRYCIQFSTSRNMPNEESRIRVVLIESLGKNGTLGATFLNSDSGDNGIMKENVPVLIDRNWEIQDTPFAKNITKNLEINSEQISYINESSSIHGSDPENIKLLKEGSEKIANAQYRNVTKSDYIGDIEKRSDIIKVNVWGENEIRSENIFDFNKIYISVIPYNWTTYTIQTSAHEWIDPMVPDITQNINIPYEFHENFQNDIKEYIEPKKVLSTYEEFIIPNLVYFKFEIGILPKRMYNFNNITIDVRDKLEYYFDPLNRYFNEIIDFRDIHNFILDTTIKSSTKKFDNVRGINNLVIRDIVLYATHNENPMEIFNLNEDNNFPMFSVNEYDDRYENILKPIKLGLNQFPMLAKDMCIIINEV